ncbi:sigma-70 family RNA polymerase sigma factor [bacterium]|nr:sigma-70 family RNA polymerase sigma factor [bacterium]
MDDHTEQDGLSCIEKVLNGDREAYRDFIRLYERLVFSLASKMISRQDQLEDVCQDVFIKIYTNLNRFRGDSAVSTWVAKITVNTCINALRKKREILLNGNEGPSDPLDRFHADDPTPYMETETADLHARLNREIAALPVQLKTAITLFHLQGLRYDEIASVMNLPEGTVKSHLFRARQLLKKRMLRKYEKEEWLL